MKSMDQNTWTSKGFEYILPGLRLFIEIKVKWEGIYSRKPHLKNHCILYMAWLLLILINHLYSSFVTWNSICWVEPESVLIDLQSGCCFSYEGLQSQYINWKWCLYIHVWIVCDFSDLGYWLRWETYPFRKQWW